MMKRRTRSFPIWLVVLLLVLQHGIAVAASPVADYRMLDREARGVQQAFIAAGGSPATNPTGLLLSFDPARPAAPDSLPALARGLSGRSAAAPAATTDDARLWVAKHWMHRGYLTEAAELLAGMGNIGDAALAAERVVLQAEILVAQGRPEQAAGLLDGVQGPQDWAAYARFNRAAALGAAGRGQEAVGILEALGGLATQDAEVLALRDKANIALGFAHLRRGEPGAAKVALDRVRFDGPFSAQALFGLGWVEFAQDNLSRALIPWTELNQRRTIEPAVQEALLLVPYTQWQLGAFRDAVQLYRQAIAILDRELALFDRLLADAQSGALLDGLAPAGVNGDFVAYRVADEFESPYVHGILSQGRFQAAHATWLHLQDIDGLLARQSAPPGLRSRVAGALANHRAWLQEYASAELARHRERATDHRARAHFELARLLDEVAARSAQQ